MALNIDFIIKQDNYDLGFDIKNNSTEFDIDFGVVTYRDGGSSEYDWYVGDYSVTPKVTAQSLATAKKLMSRNVEIKSIPYYEVDNTKGTTIYIGDEINGN